MASPSPNAKGQNSPQLRRPAAGGTPSFSSLSPSSSPSSSLFSLSDDFLPFSSSTPLHKFNGIPFSWERIPGIPKHHQSSGKAEYSSNHLLPLPPAAGNANSSIKKSNKLQQDPFITALLACSKDYEDDPDYRNLWSGSSKIMRSLSDRFGFLTMYTSCKRTCAVSESVVCLRRSPTQHYLLHRRPD